MTVTKFREHMQVRPFRPYTICMADGKELKVLHQDFIAVAPDGREAVVFGEQGEYNYVDLLLVTSIRESGPHMVSHSED